MKTYLRSPAKAMAGAILIVLAANMIAAGLTPVLPAVISQGLIDSIQRYDPATGDFEVVYQPSWCQGETSRTISGRSTALYYFERDYLDCLGDLPPRARYSLLIGWRPGDAEQFRPAFGIEVGDGRRIAGGIIEVWANRAWLWGSLDFGTERDSYFYAHLGWHRALCGAGHSCNLMIVNGDIEYFAADY